MNGTPASLRVSQSKGSTKPFTQQERLERVSRLLDQNLRRRTLDTRLHGGWQVLHGLLAYGPSFHVKTADGTEPAVAYLLSGGSLAGFEPIPGDLVSGRLGWKFTLDPSSKVGQGHRDQWLAILAQCDLPADTSIRTAAGSFTIDDLVRQAEFDVPNNWEREFSWTLIGLLHYRETDHRWTARDGRDYSIESLLRSECSRDLAASVCGGTHRWAAIAMALQHRRDEGRPKTGVWAEAAALVDKAVTMAHQNQNPDGSYSLAYFHRPGITRDLGERLGTTGHVLESIVLSAPREVLGEPFVERAVDRLCDDLEAGELVDLECGVLYHALHGLQEYYERMKP